MVQLLRAGPQGVAFLKGRLKPAKLDQDDVAKWLALLDAASFAEREQATRELATLGPAVRPALQKVLKTTESAEVRRRLDELLQRLGRADASANLQRQRGLEVLQHLEKQW